MFINEQHLTVPDPEAAIFIVPGKSGIAGSCREFAVVETN
jgi:hypothetical protein